VGSEFIIDSDLIGLILKTKKKKEKEKRRRFKWARTWSIRPNKKKRNFAAISKKWTQ
jgi:hypothetical protein